MSSTDHQAAATWHFPRPAMDAVAGAVAGGASRMVVSPLDVIKIRFQVQLEPTNSWRRLGSLGSMSSKYTGVAQAFKEIIREEGVVGLWRGILPAQLLVMPYTAIQFVVYHKFKSTMAGSTKGDDHGKLSPQLSFVGGALAGGFATIGSYPFDLLRTILASQGEPKVYKSMSDACMSILKTRGVSGFYTGLTPTIVEIIPYAGLQFGLYDYFKRLVGRFNEEKAVLRENGERDSAKLSSFQEFMCGLISGTIAKTSTHPLDVVKKRFQVEGLTRHPRYGERIESKAYGNMFFAIRRIVEREGWMGLYKGTFPSVIKAAPAAAITFTVYESVIRQLEPYCR